MAAVISMVAASCSTGTVQVQLPGDDGGVGGDDAPTGDGSVGPKFDAPAGPDGAAPGPDAGSNGMDAAAGDDAPVGDDGDTSLPVVPYGCGIYGNCPSDIYMAPTVRPFSTGKELCAWINNCRTAYSFHSRCGQNDSDDPCVPNVGATWPFAFGWDSAAGAEAQAAADSLAQGGTPSGSYEENTYDQCNVTYSSWGLWQDGLGTNKYVVSGKDIGAAWGQNCAAFGNHLAYFRTDLAYEDSCAPPKLTHFGCGVADAGGGNVWGVVIMVP